MTSISVIFIIAYYYYTNNKLDKEKEEEEEEKNKEEKAYWPIFVLHLLWDSHYAKLFICVISLCRGNGEMANIQGLAQRLWSVMEDLTWVWL